MSKGESEIEIALSPWYGNGSTVAVGQPGKPRAHNQRPSFFFFCFLSFLPQKKNLLQEEALVSRRRPSVGNNTSGGRMGLSEVRGKT